MNFDNLNNIEDSIDNENNDLTNDQEILKLLNNKIIDIDKSINKAINNINKTLCMLVADINNIKYV